MTPNGKYKAKCHLCGQVVAEFPVLDIPIIGEPDAKAKKVLAILGTHVAKSHGDQFAAGMHLLQDFQAFLILSQFQIDDPSVQARAEAIRAGLQLMTRKFTFSDAQIQNLIVQLDSTNNLNADYVGKLIREMRDVLTESGSHAPKIQTPQSSLVI